jgi:hypothetical protein
MRLKHWCIDQIKNGDYVQETTNLYTAEEEGRGMFLKVQEAHEGSRKSENGRRRCSVSRTRARSGVGSEFSDYRRKDRSGEIS